MATSATVDASVLGSRRRMGRLEGDRAVGGLGRRWWRHGWLTEEEVVVDVEMRGERKPEIGDLGRLAGIRGGLSGGKGLAGGRGCPAPAAREVGGGNWEE
jgi:hypothetical protein